MTERYSPEIEVLLTEVNRAAHSAGTNAWVRDVLKRAHRALRASQPATPRKWDEGEHEGCGIDSQRALERQSRLSAGSDDAVRLLNKLWSQVWYKRPAGDPKDTYRELLAAIQSHNAAQPPAEVNCRDCGRAIDTAHILSHPRSCIVCDPEFGDPRLALSSTERDHG